MLERIALFHAQVIVFESMPLGHNFAIFPEAPIFQGVERVPHKTMHSVIHSGCG